MSYFSFYDDKEALSRWLNLMEAAMANISCEVHRQDGTLTRRGRFMMKGKAVRIEELVGNQNLIVIRTPKQELSLATAPGEKPSGVIRMPKENEASNLVMDLRAYLGLYVLYRDRLFALNRVLKEEPSARVARTSQNGQYYYVLTYEYKSPVASARYKLEYWYDIAKNGAIHKQIKYMECDEPYPCQRNEEVVVDYDEVTPGVYMPKRIESSGKAWMKKSNEVVMQYNAVILMEDYQLHPELADDYFQLTFPPGSIVTDEIYNKLWTVLDDGTFSSVKRNGVEVTFGKGPMIFATNDPRSLLGPTRAEPGSSGLWFILGGLALLLLAVGYWLWQKRRERLEMS